MYYNINELPQVEEKTISKGDKKMSNNSQRTCHVGTEPARPGRKYPRKHGNFQKRGFHVCYKPIR